MRSKYSLWNHPRQSVPREGTFIRKVYDELMAGNEVYLHHKKNKNVITPLRDFYGVETRNIGGGKYIRIS